MRNNNITNRLIKWIVIAFDFVILWCILWLTIDIFPSYEQWDEEKRMTFWLLCTISLLLAETRFGTYIHQRQVSAGDILKRTTMLVATYTLLSYVLLRAVHFMVRIGWRFVIIGIGLLVVLLLVRFVERWILKRLRSAGYNTRHITSLVNTMLALANENTRDLLKDAEETDARDICQRALQAMPPMGDKPIEVLFDDQTTGDATRLCTNSDSLQMMLGNLLENAFKFTEKGQIRLTLSHDKTHFHFTVEDTGCGIPAEKVNTIFDRFMKVNAFTEGLGLGLAYCHETAQKLGGELRLDHTSDQGTSFTLSIPIKLNT